MSGPDGSEPASKPGWPKDARFHLTTCGLDKDHDGLCGPSPVKNWTDGRLTRISQLEARRPILVQDCEWKLREGDWHGVADAAMDLRDLEAELKGLRA